jgi:hypothetical protein
MTTIIILSLVGAIIAAAVGTFWYSNKTPMGKIHMRYLGFDKLSAAEKKAKMEEGKAMMGKMYAAQMGLSFIMSFWVVFVVTESVKNGLPLWLAFLFPVFSWLSFVVTTIGTGILWSNCDRSIAWKKFFSDISYNLVTILLIAFVTGLFV